MYEVNSEKLTARYAELVQKHSEVKSACCKEASQIASERGYNAELTEKLTNFLYVEKYKNESIDNEIAILSNYVDEVAEVKSVETAN